MSEREYLLLDVFTDRLFGGNQLAVFPSSEGLSAEQMQAVARELNLSETAFVLPAARDDALAELRIFTPGMELPFAGHPTIGAAIALATLGRIDPADGARAVLIEAAGDVPVTVTDQDGRLFAELTSPKLPVPLGTNLTTAQSAALLSLVEAKLTSIRPAGYSAGVPFLFVPVASPDALARVTLDLQVWRETLAETATPHIAAIQMDDWAQGREVSMRMFAPLMGITEDPATGAAAAALAGLLIEVQRPSDGTHRWTVHQGHKMGRPSTILLEADVQSSRATQVRVGGTAVLVGRGSLRVE